MAEPLNQQDFNSGTWLKLRAIFAEKLDNRRKENDNAALGPEQTAKLRGRIAEIKDFLALEKTPPPSRG